MTAALTDWTRRAARVQALNITTPHDLDVALCWVHAHGLAATHLNGCLYLRGPHGERQPLRCGQWLTHDPQSGEFTVWDEPAFYTAHRPPLTDAALDTLLTAACDPEEDDA